MDALLRLRMITGRSDFGAMRMDIPSINSLQTKTRVLPKAGVVVARPARPNAVHGKLVAAYKQWRH
jgi:hypothetical protein